nr:hypothetical protein [Chlamydiota bacterium]
LYNKFFTLEKNGDNSIIPTFNVEDSYV